MKPWETEFQVGKFALTPNETLRTDGLGQLGRRATGKYIGSGDAGEENLGIN
jgi:hypothetical protein